MLKAIIDPIKRVFSDASTWGGAVSAVLGWLSDQLGKPLILPSWGWWVLALLLVLITACRIEFELQKEKAKNRKPQPGIALGGLVDRITGSSDLFADGVPKKTANALIEIRGKARLGILSVWGRKDANQFSPLEPIPEDYWSYAHIDYLEFLKDSKCATGKAAPAAHLLLYSDLHFDLAEVDQTWVERKPRKFTLQWPLKISG